MIYKSPDVRFGFITTILHVIVIWTHLEFYYNTNYH